MKTKTVTNQSFAKRAVMVLVVLFTALTAGAEEFITDVMLIGTQGKSNIESLIKDYKAKGWTVIDKDLNAGCGSESDYIYLLYRSAVNTDGVNHGYITDFYIYGSESSGFDEEVTYQDRKYKLVPYTGGDKFKESKGDLNRAAGGAYIHLYYTTVPMNDEAVSKIEFNDSKSGAVGNQGGDTGYDLNKGCGSDTDYIFMHLTKENASTLTSVNYISYTFDTTNGLTKKDETCYGYHIVTNSTTTLGNGWYILSSSQSFDKRITVSGMVNLILCDGTLLEAKEGIAVAEGNTLNIFAQSEGVNVGKLKAIITKEVFSAGIGGGSYGAGGTVTVYGGMVEAHSGEHGAGIGGGDDGAGGSVTVYGGMVEAHSGEHGAGIGGGGVGAGGTVTVYGGMVEAHSGEHGAGIGGGHDGAGGTVTVYGGMVEAHSGMHGAGIGGGHEGAGGTVTIYGGTVKANGGLNGAGIGCGYDGSGGSVTIYGGYVEAHGGKNGAAGIGAGWLSDSHGTLKIGDGVNVYDGNNPMAIATGPKDNVEIRPRYMIAGGHVKGDANNDVRVNVADIVEMVNAKNNKASAKFVLKNADIDGDGEITQSDLDAVVKIIMKK